MSHADTLRLVPGDTARTASVRSAVEALVEPTLEPLFWDALRLGAPSAWWQHVPFARWLVAAMRPGVLVELGTHAGVSYSAFCQAVRGCGLATRCHAVDTWRGDAHAGAYEEATFTEFNAFHQQHFSAFSTLIRATFDEARAFFADGSIDLLHIDGFHTYDAVRHDFESWLPKLSDKGVVLFHDVNERRDDFGVWKFWEELLERFPGFTFLHGHGLGVLAVGAQVSSDVLELCRLRDPDNTAAVRARFAALGDRFLATAQRLTAERNAATAEQAAHNARQERDHLGGGHDELRSSLHAAEAELEQVRRELKDLQAGAVSQRVDPWPQVRRAAAERAAQARQQAVAAREQAAAMSDELARLREQAAAMSDHAAQLHDILATTEARADAAEAELRMVMSSTAWQASWPLRRAGRHLPARLRRYVRGGMKLMWWGTTFKVRSKLLDRRAPRQPVRIDSSPQPAVPRAALLTPTAPQPPHDAPAAASAAERGLAGLRLVYVSGEPESPGHVYRVERHLAIAEALGVRVTSINVADLPGAMTEVASANILVLWRTIWSEAVSTAAALARENGARVVFDVDDLMIDPALARTEIIDGIRSQFLTEDQVRDHYTRVRQSMEASDACFAATEELAFHFRWNGRTTWVLPNGFDQATHDLSVAAARAWRRSRTDQLIRIGYAGGSRTHQKDFGVAVAAIARLLHENDECRLVLFRASDSTPLIDIQEFPELTGLEHRIEWRTLQPLRLLAPELARFDINIAPLEYDNPFCEAKSELKFFEAALVDVPTVASPTGSFRRAINHGVDGFLAASADDWYHTLRRLANEPALRRRVAVNAHRSSLAAFGPLRRELRFRRVLAQLIGGFAGADAFALEALSSYRPWTSPKVFDSEMVFEHDAGASARITVIVPLHNYEDYITEALDSVRAQTLKALDLIVVDDGSTDNSLSVAVQWMKRNAQRFNRAVVLRNLDNYGLGFCRNCGFDAASSQFVLPLDADNKLLPSCCDELLAAADQNRAAFVYSTIQAFGNSDKLLSDRPWEPHHLVAGNFIDAMALISKEAWAVVGGYDHVRYGWEDFDLWCRMAEHGIKGLWHDRVLALYRVHHASMLHRETLASGNHKTLIEAFNVRRPWVSLVDYFAARHIPKSDPHLRTGAERTRLDALLPILRCPHTGSRLAWNADRTALMSVDGMRAWPVTAGRPVLAAHLANPVIHSDSHISNDLPEEALALIRETKGWVLNLSAGGSREKFDHVLEVEYAIFRHTDIVSDAHVLPFYDETFDAIVVMNAFEHYAEPHKVAAELKRVLKPTGRVLVRTAFLQPLHEKPYHFFNCTRYGLEQWFKDFETETLHVSANFCPNHSVTWLASEAEAALRADHSVEAAEAFAEAPVGKLVELWRDPARRADPLWSNFEKLSQEKQEVTAAGFEFLGRKPTPSLKQFNKAPE